MFTPTRIFLSLLLGFSLVITLIPSVRKVFKEKFIPEEKIVLSEISVDLLNNGKLLKILKVRTKKGLSIEIYPHPSQPNNDFKPVTYLIGDFKDAFFQIGGSSENLFAKDFDKDGILEIVAPSIDAKWETHLNIFKYNSFTKNLELSSKNNFDMESL